MPRTYPVQYTAIMPSDTHACGPIQLSLRNVVRIVLIASPVDFGGERTLPSTSDIANVSAFKMSNRGKKYNQTAP